MSASPASSPVTVEHEMMDSGMMLQAEQLRTRTLPGAQTRDRSLRRRSTIMRFSARSFVLSVSATPSAKSCSGPTPRGRVPLIGRVSTRRASSSFRKRSGDALATIISPKSR